MASFLHSQNWLVSEVPYKPVQTIVCSLQPLQVGSMCGWACCPHPHRLLVFIGNKWLYDKLVRHADCQGHWVCMRSWLMLPTESIPCQFEWVPALVLLELSSAPAGTKVLPVPSRWITETLFTPAIDRPQCPHPPHQGLCSLRRIYQHFSNV